MEFIVFILLTALAICLYFLFRYRHQAILQHKILWCASPDNWNYKRCTYLSDYLRQWQASLESPKYMIITDDEWKFADEILSDYQVFIWRLYQSEALDKRKDIVKHKCEDFLAVSLNWFLEKHACDLYFHDYRLYCTKEITPWGDNSLCFDAVYTLTSYGCIYHKLHLIVQSRLLSIGKSTSAEISHSKKVLDSKEIGVWSYN